MELSSFSLYLIGSFAGFVIGYFCAAVKTYNIKKTKEKK